MYIIKRIDQENILYFSIKGIITEDQGARAVQELNSTVRNLEKGFILLIDARRFKPASYDNAISITKSAIKLLSIKRPSLILRIGPRDILKILDKAYLELNIPISFKLIDSEEYQEIIPKVDSDTTASDILKDWIHKNLYQLKDGQTPPGEAIENDIDITSFALNGIPLENKSVSFSASAYSHKGKRPFYRFAYCMDYTGGMGNQEPWNLMTEHEALSIGKCEFTFNRPGKYIVSVKASSSENLWDHTGIPEARLTIFVRPDSETSTESKSPECYNDFPFSPGANVEVIYNKESISPVIRNSVIYECDLTAQSIVISYVNPESEYGLKFDSIDIAVQCPDHEGRKSRKGINIVANRKITNYPVSNNETGEALLARFTLPVEPIGLRCDRQFYRCECSAFSKYIEAELDLHDHFFISGQDFSIVDLSLTGVGLNFFDDAPLYRIIKNLAESNDNGHISFKFYDPSKNTDDPHIVTAEFKIMRKNFCAREACCKIGLRFTDIGVSEGSQLNHFITVLQLEEKK